MAVAPQFETSAKKKKKGSGAAPATTAVAAGMHKLDFTKSGTWLTTGALAAGLVGGEALHRYKTDWIEFGGKDGHAVDARWILSGTAIALSAAGFWKGWKIAPALGAAALGFGLSWAVDRIASMWDKADEKAATRPALNTDGTPDMDGDPANSSGIYIGSVDDIESGAIGLARRLNRTENTIGRLRQGKEDALQARLEAKQAAGKRLTRAQQAFLTQERAEDRQQAARRAARALPGPAIAPAAARLGGRPEMVTVPISAVRPGFLARLA